MKRKRERGMTLIERIIIISVMGILGGSVLVGVKWVLIKGNYWLNKETALSCVQVSKPAIVKVIIIERAVFSYAKVVAEDKDGKRETVQVDTDILWNCEVVSSSAK